MKNEEFIEKLFFSEYEKLCTYAEHTLIDRDNADDVVQDTFHEAVKKFDVLISHPNPAGWLMQTLKHKIRDYNRSTARHLRRFVPIKKEHVLPYEEKDFDMGRSSIADIISTMKKELDPDDYYLVHRIAIEGASHLTVSKELGISVHASQKRLERIRKKIKKFFL